MNKNLIANPQKVNFLAKCKAARRKEKCRNCVYFFAADLKCQIWPDERLTTEMRWRGCTSYKRNIWGPSL